MMLKKQSSNICIVGTGYVGLTCGLCFAEANNQVVCMDIDKKKIDALKSGNLPLHEKKASLLLKKNLKKKTLRFTSSMEDAIKHSQYIFLALPTPTLKDGKTDLWFLETVCLDLIKYITKPSYLFLKSTVPVGTQKKFSMLIRKHSTLDIPVISNPEFLKEGSAVDDFFYPERIIVGVDDKQRIKEIEHLFLPFVKSKQQILFMDPASAELSKYACNGFLASKISYINEMAKLSDLTGANIKMIEKAMATDSRIGKDFLKSGIGYGGSCFKKDIKSLIKQSENHQLPLKILQATQQVNEKQVSYFVDKFLALYDADTNNKKIAIWGGAFKANTDDIRESPTLYIIKKLLNKNFKIYLYDPAAMDNIKMIFKNKISYGEDMYEVLNQASALLITTEWEAFGQPNVQSMIKKMYKRLIFDGRNILNKKTIAQYGFTYHGMGRF